VSRGGFRTRREAGHAFAELRDEIHRGDPLLAGCGWPCA